MWQPSRTRNCKRPSATRYWQIHSAKQAKDTKPTLTLSRQPVTTIAANRFAATPISTSAVAAPAKARPLSNTSAQDNAAIATTAQNNTSCCQSAPVGSQPENTPSAAAAVARNGA